MNYGKTEVSRKLRRISSKTEKLTSRMIFLFVKLILVAVLLMAAFAASLGYGALKGIIDSAPEIDVASIEPSGYATMVYDREGNLTETLVKSGANRLEATYEELPQCLIDAFVAIEDSRFWSHKGIDIRSILRAAVGVITGESAGGGSTLTQQLIKNNIFEGGNENTFGEKLERKIQEQYLAVQLEKIMDKKIILKNYLKITAQFAEFFLFHPHKFFSLKNRRQLDTCHNFEIHFSAFFFSFFDTRRRLMICYGYDIVSFAGIFLHYLRRAQGPVRIPCMDMKISF